jgi:DNA-binding FadR family transcriptional regulator
MARQMALQRARQEELAQSGARKTRLLILRLSGRLPSMRDLSERPWVLRPSPRKAGSALQPRGLQTSRTGAGTLSGC